MNEPWKTGAAEDIQVADKPTRRVVGTEFLLCETGRGQAFAELREPRDAA